MTPIWSCDDLPCQTLPRFDNISVHPASTSLQRQAKQQHMITRRVMDDDFAGVDERGIR